MQWEYYARAIRGCTRCRLTQRQSEAVALSLESRTSDDRRNQFAARWREQSGSRRRQRRGVCVPVVSGWLRVVSCMSCPDLGKCELATRAGDDRLTMCRSVDGDTSGMFELTVMDVHVSASPVNVLDGVGPRWKEEHPPSTATPSRHLPPARRIRDGGGCGGLRGGQQACQERTPGHDNRAKRVDRRATGGWPPSSQPAKKEGRPGQLCGFFASEGC
jgi:hypothetical protein